MTVDQIAGLILALVVMLVGVAGCLFPGIPSSPLVLAGAIGHRLYFGANSASNLVLGILAAITLFSLVLDYLASVYGAKRMGATWRGVLGAIIGGTIGIFFNLPGLLLGPFLGALVFELAGGRDFEASSRAGVGATLGLLAGTVGKMACCGAMMGIFTINVVMRSGGG